MTTTDPLPDETTSRREAGTDSGQPGAAARSPGATADPVSVDEPAARRQPLRAATWVLLHLVLPAAVLVGAVLYGRHLTESGPEAVRRPRVVAKRVVETVTVRAGTARPSIEAMGTVIAAREIEVRPRVAGSVAWVADDLSPGGVVTAGQTIARLDPTDFEIAVRTREAAVAESEADLMLEKGRQALALREYELLGIQLVDEDRERVLRAPQWAQAQAVLASRKADLEHAKHELERTEIAAPFDALVLTRDIELGAQLSTSSRLSHLVGVREFWVEVVLPLDRVRWIRFPREDGVEGSPASVADSSSWGPGRARAGRVLRLLGALETSGRMARVLVAVDDPLGRDAHGDEPRLLLGAYVRVEIQAEEVADVIPLDVALVRDGSTTWVVGENDELEIRTLDIVLRDRERVYVRGGLADGERVVVTELSTPVAGMALAVSGDVPPAPEPPASTDAPERREPAAPARDGAARSERAPDGDR